MKEYRGVLPEGDHPARIVVVEDGLERLLAAPEGVSFSWGQTQPGQSPNSAGVAATASAILMDYYAGVADMVLPVRTRFQWRAIAGLSATLGFKLTEASIKATLDDILEVDRSEVSKQRVIVGQQPIAAVSDGGLGPGGSEIKWDSAPGIKPNPPPKT